jgi:hypothetical protein
MKNKNYSIDLTIFFKRMARSGTELGALMRVARCQFYEMPHLENITETISAPVSEYGLPERVVDAIAG